MKCLMNDIAGIIRIPADDREYAEMIRGRWKWYWLLILLGACALGLSLSNEFIHFTAADSFINGVYSGVGTAFAGIGILKMLSERKLLKDEKKLHTHRIERFDEREVELTRKAVVTTFVIFSFLLFAAMLIIGYFDRTVFWCSWTSFILYMLLFAAIRGIYGKRM